MATVSKTMKIIDARSGKEVHIGDVIDYGEPSPPEMVPVSTRRLVPNPRSYREWWKLLDVKDRLFSAQAHIEYHHSNGVVSQVWGPLAVRFTHPSFPFQRVAFVPT